MIKLLERYIAKTIVYASLMTGLIIVGVLFLISLLKELKNVGEADYGFNQAVMYVLMRMPGLIYQFAPMLILLGSIAGLSILSSYRELAVMRVSGFSVRHIIASTLGAALVLTLFMAIVGEGLAPKLNYMAEVSKENSRNAGQAIATTAGIWLHLDNSFIHIEHVVNRQLLENVTRYQFDNHHHLLAAYFAKTLAYQNGQWTMYDVAKTTFYPERTKSQFFAKGEWNIKFNSNLLNVGLIDPDEMSLSKLSKFSYYLEQNGLRASEYQYEFWRRLFQPLASLIMIFLAVPFVLGTFQASSLGFRVVMGVMTGFGFFILNAFLGQICVVYQVPALVAAFLPLLVFAIVGLFLSNKLIRN